MKHLFFLCLIFSSFFLTMSQQTCTTHNFSNKKNFARCTDLHVLNSTIHWNYHPSNGTIDVAFRQPVAVEFRWVAWAINPNSTGMVGSQAIVAFRRSTDGYISVYASPIKSYGTQLEEGDLSFPLYNLSGAYENNEIIIFATIGLPKNVTTVNHIWQEGPLFGHKPAMHSVSGPHVKSFSTMDFITGKNNFNPRMTLIRASTSPHRTLKYIHAISSTIGWGILLPIGAILVGCLKLFNEDNYPAWFKYLHRSCQSLAYGVGISGFATGLWLHPISSGVEDKWHKYLGIAVFFLATIQLEVALLFRPKSTHNYWWLWDLFHSVLGIVTIDLAICNIFIGFDILKPEKKWKDAYIGIFIFLGCSYLLISLIRILTSLISHPRFRNINIFRGLRS